MLDNISLLSLVGAYALGHVFGSVPSGLWLVQALHGIDIREYGSKNIGTTNVYRTVGAKTAVLVLLADMLKGIFAIMALGCWVQNPVLNVICGLGAFMGHSYSLFLGFKGGKGVATGLGLLVYLMPAVSAMAFGVWLVLVLLTRYVSLGSIVAALLTPVFAWYLAMPLPYLIFAAICGLFVVIRHKDNINRLLAGTESKIKQGNPKDIKK